MEHSTDQQKASGRQWLPHSGLSAEEAASRLRAEGFNELPHQNQRHLVRIVLDVLREPMLAMLIGAGLIYMTLGDIQDALILMTFAGLSILITVVQERRTERALEALRDLTSPRALVIRDGVRTRVAGREVVRGDLVVLSEGDRVPADGWLLQNDGLHIDESLLTGESVAVTKTVCPGAHPPEPVRPGGDGLPFVYSGSLVVRGSGLYTVIATGLASEIGRIGKVLSSLETEVPRLRLQTRKLVLWFAGIGLTASALAVVLFGLFRGSWLDASLAGIALGMSLLPEEFPVVLTIFMAMGAMRMSRNRVLTRQASAIETLGSATTLCTDKTGTLTQNRMQIAELHLPDGRSMVQGRSDGSGLVGEFHLLAELGILASAQQPVDPMEAAFHELGDALAPKTVRRRQNAGWTLDRQYPLDPPLLAMSHAWGHSEADEGVIIAAKGAPESIADLCVMDERERTDLTQTVNAMADRGLRVLGVAEARWFAGPLPQSQRDFRFTFRGLVGLADPLRASVPDAVRQCRGAGIRVVMITGDYPQTARAIALQAGIDADHVMTGEELGDLPDEELRKHIASVSICARIMPEQKLRLVSALKQSGEIVAMTGDGVNDAPSLKAAHIGIAMGGRGTDVAREASSIVLLDDDFGSIVKAIRMGRRIYDNLRKAMGFIVAVHIPVAGLALLPLITGMPLILGPVHIAFLEMIIDPVCSLAFEAEEEEVNVMERPPRAPDSPLFSRSLLVWSVLQGGLVLIATAGLTGYFWNAGMEAEQLRSSAFLTLVVAIAVLILANRRYSTSIKQAFSLANPALAMVLGIVASVMLATQLIAPITKLFRFSPVTLENLLPIALAGFAVFLLLERLKAFWITKVSA